MLLEDLAKLEVGYLFRSRPPYVEKGGRSLVQIMDVSAERGINWRDVSQIRIDSIRPQLCLKAGDVLVKAKGENLTAAEVIDPPDSAIASAQLIVIRIKNQKKLLPGYLAWYINQPPAQKILNQLSAGSSIRHLSRISLSVLPIPIPRMEIQQKIVRLMELQRKENELVALIQQKRKKLMERLLLSFLSTNEVEIEKIRERNPNDCRP